jgi:superfamily I DNA and/or RNA helicase
MLTPCFVTTMQSGPGFFDYAEQGQTEPLFNTLDLLVVDEAGQVVPELSGAMVALAQQVLVVGDTQQIRPIHNISRQQDSDTLLAANVIQQRDQADDPRIRALAASRGSVMEMAHNRATFHPQCGEPGLFLAEHRRSVPAIIEYCNWLAYEGKLRPLRPAIPNYPFPHLGYLHVEGEAQKAGSSRRNQHEAAVIAYWLAQNRSLIEQYYEAQLGDIVGIITPFTAQRQMLNAALSAQRLKIETVGTIHALQGGERPMIIFSPVYTAPVEMGLFFDQNVNMLNVAVSRAQDSFLVMGDMNVFDTERATPSGLLARYLFSAESNQLTND